MVVVHNPIDTSPLLSTEEISLSESEDISLSETEYVHKSVDSKLIYETDVAVLTKAIPEKVKALSKFCLFNLIIYFRKKFSPKKA